jgi:hypothetical protein
VLLTLLVTVRQRRVHGGYEVKLGVAAADHTTAAQQTSAAQQQSDMGHVSTSPAARIPYACTRQRLARAASADSLLAHRLSSYALRNTHVWKSCALEALADALAQARGVLDGLEELAVLTHALYAKRVVHTANLHAGKEMMRHRMSCRLPHSCLTGKHMAPQVCARLLRM